MLPPPDPNGKVFTGDDAPSSQMDILIEDGMIEAVASDLSATGLSGNRAPQGDP